MAVGSVACPDAPFGRSPSRRRAMKRAAHLHRGDDDRVTRLTAFESSEASPVDGCSGVYVVLTAPSRMAAVEKLRMAGFSAHGIEKAAPGSEHERAALERPGVILW